MGRVRPTLPICEEEIDRIPYLRISKSDPDRRAAEYVLSIGGIIRINGGERDVRDVKELPKEAFQLTVVNLDANKELTDAGLAHFKDCKNLTLLYLSNTQVSDAGLAHFKDCKNLTYLDVRKTKVTAKALEEFHAAVPGCKIEHDGGVIEAVDVDRKAAEYAISIGGVVSVNGGNRNIKAVGELPKDKFFLSLLNLHGNTQVSDAGLAHFKECKNLTQLTLNGTQVSDAGLAHFKDCKNLTHLYLSNTQVSDAGLAHFKDCKNLTHLNLLGTQVSDAGLAHFKDCKNLTHLNLLGTQVSDAGLAHFKDCKNLTQLGLNGTQVSDAGLAHFKDCKNLTQLYLSNTQVSDAGLAQFKDCKNLKHLDVRKTKVKHLDVRKTKVTAKALEEFHAAVPGCKIVHDGGVIEPKK
ncbi:MAG: hypothetical protein FJ304_04415 [Planctomycetes bacterium]|nr:hypothetical protein [Planctomycetota bacterium]